MRVLVASFLLLLPLMLMPVVSGRPNSGVAKVHRDHSQASERGLQEGVHECECKDWLLRVSKRKFIIVPELKQCSCDHFKINMKKTRQGHHRRQPIKLSSACKEFFKQCQLKTIPLIIP